VKDLVEPMVSKWLDEHVDMIRHHHEFPQPVSLIIEKSQSVLNESSNFRLCQYALAMAGV